MATVIYRDKCADGLTAAWVLWKKLGGDARYVPVSYGDSPPDVWCDDVYIVGFSYPRETLLSMREAAKSMVVYDHHKSAQKDLDGLDFAVFDTNRSSAGLAWDSTFPDTSRPIIVDYVEDRDLCRYWLPKSLEINSYIGILPRFFEALDGFGVLTFEEVVTAGGAALAERRAAVGEAFSQAVQYLDFAGESGPIPVVNTLPRICSDLLSDLIVQTNADFAVSWHQMSDGRFKYSLRSTGRVDVSRIAEGLGGGGHDRAAGFVSDLPPWEIGIAPWTA